MFIWLSRHRKLAAIALALVACFALPAAAQAAHAPGRALLHAPAFVTAPPPLPCPTGVPTQAITVVNQAAIPSIEILRLENALVAQSVQLRAAWDTPCVQFGPNGWPLTLLPGTDASVPLIGGGCSCGGFHSFSGQPYAEVSTDGSGLPRWDQPFESLWEVAASHELMEMLVDPQPGAHPQEVCDPVSWQSYTYGTGPTKVPLADFVTPAWFTGGPGPYDAMDLLTGPYESDVQTWGSAT